MDNLADITAWLIALRTPSVGPGVLRRHLATGCGSMAAVLARLRKDAGRLDAQAQAWLNAPDPARIEQDLAWLAQPGHRLLRCTEGDFPPLLEHIPQPPAALFVVGRCELLLFPQVAIVGARRASAAGLAHARDFAGHLAAAGLVITSGLADGIDGAAHLGALQVDGPTVAVMGTGPDRIYPRKHLALARRIAEHGALVSEFPPDTAAKADHFPRRNRIIAGLSLGTLVVEASLRSGSLITARLAGEQGREVMALPGSIHNPLARGCHRLIRDGARLVEEPGEVFEALEPAAQSLGLALAQRLQTLPAPPLSMAIKVDPPRQRLLDALGHDPLELDELAARTGQSAAQLCPLLLMLEVDGLVATFPGNRYQRVRA